MPAFDERLGLLVDPNVWRALNNRLGRLVKEAKLPLSQASIEDVDPARRELHKAVVRQLASCRWVHERKNLIVSGMTGTGSSMTSHRAPLDQSHPGRRPRDRRLGLTPAGDHEWPDFFGILDDRYANRAITMTNQLPSKTWHADLVDQTSADAILDRIFHKPTGSCRAAFQTKAEKDTEAE